MAKRTQKDRNWGSGKKNMMKVLIVDDDEALVGLIKEMIDRMDIYRVKTAANGEEGYEVFSSSSNPISFLPISRCR